MLNVSHVLQNCEDEDDCLVLGLLSGTTAFCVLELFCIPF